METKQRYIIKKCEIMVPSWTSGVSPRKRVSYQVIDTVTERVMDSGVSKKVAEISAKCLNRD